MGSFNLNFDNGGISRKQFGDEIAKSHQWMTNKDTQQLLNIFDIAAGKDKILTKEEASQVLSKMQEIDTNHDSKLSAEEIKADTKNPELSKTLANINEMVTETFYSNIKDLVEQANAAPTNQQTENDSTQTTEKKEQHETIAEERGYKETAISKDKKIYYDVQNKQYVRWSDKNKNFVKLNGMTDINESGVMTFNGIRCRYNDKGKLVKVNDANGQIGEFQQGGTGDCWLLSAITALNNNDAGKAMIKDIVQTDGKGNVTINLKGANKTYTISADELDAKDFGQSSYSKGDRDVLALEIAVEKFRTEVSEMKQNGQNISQYSSFISGTLDPENILDGGDPIEAIQLLTGKSAKLVSSNSKDFETTKNKIPELLTTPSPTAGNGTTTPKTIVSVGLKDDSGGGHAVTVLSMNDDTVTYLDTNISSSKPQTMNREEFFAKIGTITYSDLSSPVK